MNEIPQEVLENIPSQWQTHFNTFLIVWFFLSRAVKNLKAGGGLYGLYTGIVWGDKIPAAKQADDAQRDAKTRTTNAPFPNE